MNFFENITLRRTRTKSLSETTEINTNDVSCINTTLDGTTNSMPNISDDEENDKVQNLQREIEELKSQLLAAHDEITNLSIENSELKQNISTLNNKYQLVKNATRKLTTEVGTTLNNVRLSTPNKKQHTTIQLDLTRKTVQEDYKPDTTSRVKTTLKFNKKTIGSHQKNDSNSSKLQTKKNKLCIISSNKTNKVLHIAQNAFPNHQVCHYITPNCGISTLVSNLDSKLTNYTMQDYCVILIGSEDFNSTKNYSDLISNMRENLLMLSHTNIILCLPTYRCNDYSSMFNWRIEMFNSLLYHDIQIYDYAVIFDSNLNLLYDYTMFSKNSGRLNNRGMRTIFDNLKYEIMDSDISNHTCTTPETETNSDIQNSSRNSDFFRV
ncbi:hypothetical protein PYW08_009638 [Mythimna loreyi]|uniref:Uncharacterized protein n=1 Tax=Mythimna loreyi TaxID=667449 RepID=A0ACC2Q7B0_9NEOP|nr:hypothetical protein PYW08_009638 [Mythimna loreyi]